MGGWWGPHQTYPTLLPPPPGVPQGGSGDPPIEPNFFFPCASRRRRLCLSFFLSILREKTPEIAIWVFLNPLKEFFSQGGRVDRPPPGGEGFWDHPPPPPLSRDPLGLGLHTPFPFFVPSPSGMLMVDYKFAMLNFVGLGQRAPSVLCPLVAGASRAFAGGNRAQPAPHRPTVPELQRWRPE